jgi:hypothetical protein
VSVRGLVIFFIAVAAWAQPAARPAPIFPTDNQDLKQGDAAELLEVACPGKVVAGKDLTCGNACPEFTGMRGDVDLGWHVAAVIRGHFLSPTSDDAALAVVGCEPHTMNFGGTILFTRHSKKWTMLWYQPGVHTEKCHRVPLADSREILVCMGWYGAQGYVSTALYTEDLLSPAGSLMAEEGHAKFFEVVDNTLTCGRNSGNETKPEPLKLEFIERVTFGIPSDRTAALSVIANYGEKAMPPAEVTLCEDGPGTPAWAANLPTKRYQIDFRFDGVTYYVTSWSLKAAGVLPRH